jgi:hypothetical protein
MLRLSLLVMVLSSTASGFTVSPFDAAPCSRQVAITRRDTVFRASSEDEEELVRVPRRRQRGRFYDKEEEEEAFYDSVEQNIYGDDEFDDDDEDWDEDDDDDDEDDEDYGMFSNVLIDNPILDRIDPDGAAERFPELARDPRFWFDMALFIALLNWLSAVGPQDYFPDIPYYV